MKIKPNREEEAQKEDYLSVHIYENISILPTAWCPLNNENFYTKDLQKVRKLRQILIQDKIAYVRA